MDSASDDRGIKTDEIMRRLELVEQRLSALGYDATPSGLTQPDPGAIEQWNGAQVWAHMAEFVAYWQAQLEHVVDTYAGKPVPFGRTKEDAARIEGIETGRSVPIAVLMERVHDGIEATRRYLPTLTTEQWRSVGLHSRRGEMTVPQIVEKFTIDHLEEHADQLDDLS